MEIISSIIGIIGFLIASYTFYQTQIRKAKLQIIAGPTISLYYTQDGGAGLYVPFAFVNDGTRSANVVSIYLQLKTPDKKTYKLRWSDFVQWNASKRSFKHIDHCRSFSVNGNSVIDKFIWFIWRPQNADKLHFKEGKYQVSILYDNSANAKNKLQTFRSEFVVEPNQAEFLSTELKSHKTGIVKINFTNFDKENEIIGNHT